MENKTIKSKDCSLELKARITEYERISINITSVAGGLSESDYFDLEEGAFLENKMLFMLKLGFDFPGIGLESIEEDTEYVDKRLRELGLMEKQLFEAWKPKMNEDYWFIDSQGLVDYHEFLDDNTDRRMLLTGNCYKTKKEAEMETKRDRAVQKIKEWATRENGGWEPDWSNENEFKYFVSSKKGDLVRAYAFSLKYAPDNFMFLKSKELAERIKEELKEELELYWRI